LASPDILKQHVASTLWCVGARTAAAARARGFSVIEEPAPDARDLAARMIARAKPRSHYLYLAGRDRKPFLEQTLRDANHHVESLVVYEARAAATLPQVATAALGASEVDAILHFSRRSVDLLLSLARDAGIGEALTRARHVCISDDAAAPLRAAGIEARVAATPDFPGLVAALGAAT
jgi:uroporphyrinogen-III synthase